MSVCSCSYDDGDALGGCVLGGGPRTARKAGRSCPNCGQPVLPGQQCVDYGGLRCSGDGFFSRFHVECWELMERFVGKMGCDFMAWPFDLEEAAKHAMAHGEYQFWRDWLLLYEQTWKYEAEAD